YNKGMTAVIEGQLSVRAMLDDLQARMKPLLEQTPAAPAQRAETPAGTGRCSSPPRPRKIYRV
ncbi:MAG TPA: hypothetical protein VHS99_20960, partial [Chloroflexota bacterium]|nr:hypothetical protein [Chloroflexota bacterium]